MSKAGFLLISVPPAEPSQSVDTTYRSLESLISLDAKLADSSKFSVPEFKVFSLFLGLISETNALDRHVRCVGPTCRRVDKD